MQPLVMLFPSIYHTGLVFDPAYGNKVERQHENFVGEVKISTEKEGERGESRRQHKKQTQSK